MDSSPGADAAGGQSQPASASATSASPEPLRIGVIGLGAFGTAMAHCAARNGHEVVAYCRSADQREAINSTHRNPKAKGLEDLELSPRITAVASVAEAVAGAAIILHALPAQKTPAFISEHRETIPATAVFCSLAKGLFLERHCLLSEAMLESFGRAQPLVVLSGPSFAKQIVQGHPTVVVVASKLLYHAVSVQRALSSKNFRVYASQDLVGVELGGALKNPLAIGAGFIEGSGYGINTMAAYLTRACRELQILCVAMGGRAETVNGLSGIGDLMLTAFGELSRNRTCGMRMSRGETLQEIMADITVEGVPTADVAMHFAQKCNLDLPIFSMVHAILHGKSDFKNAIDIVMTRPLGTETPLL